MIKAMNNIMKHIKCDGFGGPSVMKVGESAIPQLKPNQVLIKVKATGINRADTLQRQGKYPNPPWSSDILGLEAAGNIVDEQGLLGTRVIALLSGGGYAQYVAVNKDHVIPIPESITWEEAGGIAEVYLTAYLQLQLCQLQKGNSCLVYAAASGVGIATIQLCNLKGIKAIGSCSESKIPIVKTFTPYTINRELSPDEQIKLIKEIEPKGVDAVLDPVGQQNTTLTIDALKVDGKWLLYGTLSGVLCQKFNLGALLAKRVNLISTTLRTRSDVFKSQLISNFIKDHADDLKNGQLKPVIHKVVKVNWNEGADKVFQQLHTEMEQNQNAGKLVVVFDD